MVYNVRIHNTEAQIRYTSYHRQYYASCLYYNFKLILFNNSAVIGPNVGVLNLQNYIELSSKY